MAKTDSPKEVQRKIRRAERMKPVCGKKNYATKLDALIALADTEYKGKTRNHRRDETRAYFCPNCKKWHLTSIKVQPARFRGEHDGHVSATENR